jgi:hypothetical protein
VYGHLFPSLDVELADRLGDVRAGALAARLRHAGDPTYRSDRDGDAPTSGSMGWALEDSNLRPLACKASALPLS